MPIPVTCQCGKRFKAHDEHAGKRTRCPACNGMLQIAAAPTEVREQPAATGKQRVDRPAAGKRPVRRAAPTVWPWVVGAAGAVAALAVLVGGVAWALSGRGPAPSPPVQVAARTEPEQPREPAPPTRPAPPPAPQPPKEPEAPPKSPEPPREPAVPEPPPPRPPEMPPPKPPAKPPEKPPEKPPMKPQPAIPANLTLAQKLNYPINFSGWEYDPRLTLGDALAALGNRYQLKFDVAQADFKKQNLPDVLKQHVHLPPLRQVKVSTVIQLLLDQVGGLDENAVAGNGVFQATYAVKGDRLLIVPAGHRLPRDESRTSPLKKKLDAAVALPRDLDPKATVGEILEFLATRADVNIVFYRRTTNAEVSESLRNRPVKLPAKPPASLGAALKQLLDPAGATCIIRSDHILIVPDLTSPP